jgi:hypothetical protein
MVHTNTVIALIHARALIAGCLSLRFDLMARKISAATIAIAKKIVGSARILTYQHVGAGLAIL